MKKIGIIIVMATMAQIAISGNGDYLKKISQIGYGMRSKEWSNKNPIVLKQPNCAYMNIYSIPSIPQKKGTDAHGWLDYYDPANDVHFQKRVIVDAQGNSSLQFPKKNIAIDFCEDEWVGDSTTSISIGDWVSQDGFHLKAYYNDWLRGIGTVGYWVYDDIVADHETYLERAGVQQYDPQARCYPDGFPCIVYVNGAFHGIYSLSLKKHRDNMGMDKKTAEHIHLDGKLSNGTFWNGTIDWTQFEVRNPKNLYCVTKAGDTQYAKYDGDNPKELIDENMPYYDPNNKDHVRTAQVKHYIESLSHVCATLKTMQDQGASVAQMRAAIEERFDMVSVVDYLVHFYIINNIDGVCGKNWQWITYDGNKWSVAPYDLDMTFGNHYTGYFTFPAEWDDTGTHIEWRPSEGPMVYIARKYYIDDYYERYRTLRKSGAVTSEKIFDYCAEWHNRVGASNYSDEYTQWSNSYCIRPTICNANWTTSDDWSNWGKYDPYNAQTTYQAGDKCTYLYHICTATAATTGVVPFAQIGYEDNLERYETWITERIRLLDSLMQYKPEPVPSETMETLQDCETDIVKLYDIFGYTYPVKAGLKHGLYLQVTGDGKTRKVIRIP
ncbi:MAG: CotH kinase family protein [Paludibacteraceae bacterium]|nr:CotH kinase family protein [Paludibacteraceae bacterium]